MKQIQHLAHIRQLCCLGIAGQALMPALLRSVREYVNAESAGFFWVNAQGDMTNLYAERMLTPGLMRLYFERHYDGKELPFRQAFQQRARASDAISISVPNADLVRTSYYNEILRHLDAHHVMYAVIRDQGHALGQLSLYRPRDAPAFAAKERAAVKDLTNYIAHAVGHPAVSGGNEKYVDTEHEGLVLIDERGLISQGTTHSLHLLAMATQAEFNQSSLPLMAGDNAPDVVTALLDTLRLVMLGGETNAPRTTTNTLWGRFHLSAYALDDAQKNSVTAVRIRRQERLVVKLAEALGTLDLPLQQREVALLIAQGKSNPQIASALNVSSNTASYHVKQLFMRLDVHERSQAIEKILDAG